MSTVEPMIRDRANRHCAATRALPAKERRAGDEGLMALELAIMMPVFIIMLLTVVAFGRVTHGRQLVDDAAAAGARAAALSGTPADASVQARTAVVATLTQAGLSCQAAQVDVDTSRFVAGGQVTVAVRCTSRLSGLALTGLPGRMTLAATSRAPIETYRDLSGAGAAP